MKSIHLFSRLRARKNLLLIFSAIVFVCSALFLLWSFGGSELTAGILPPDWQRPLEPVSEFVQPPEEGNAVDQIQVLFWKNIVPIAKYILVAVAILFFVLDLYQMITSSGEEEAISTSRKNMLWAVLGFLVIATAMDLAEAFDIWRNGGEFVNKAVLEDTQWRVVSYFQLLASIIAFFYVFYAGFRLVTAHGEEEIVNEQKNHLKWGFVGLMFVMLSDALVNRIFYPSRGERGLGSSELTALFVEGVGALKFFLTFVGVLALLAFIASGVMYILAGGDDGATEKARKNMVRTAIVIVIILTSYILVVSFVPPGPAQV